ISAGRPTTLFFCDLKAERYSIFNRGASLFADAGIHDQSASTQMNPIKRALISVSDKTGIIDFARELKNFNVEIISTGGTAKALRDAGIEVRDISDVTGFPEMMDGRVKTLHPRVHGALLALRNNLAHLSDMNQHGIEPIDLVIVNLY